MQTSIYDNWQEYDMDVDLTNMTDQEWQKYLDTAELVETGLQVMDDKLYIMENMGE